MLLPSAMVHSTKATIVSPSSHTCTLTAASVEASPSSKAKTSSAAGESSCPATTPAFISALRKLMNRANPKIIRWSEDTLSIEIMSITALEEDILPKYFRSGRFQSFQRQLNYFGFRKVNRSQHKICIYHHPFFRKHHPEFMKWIRRRSSSTLHSTTPLMLWTPSIPNMQAALTFGQEKSRAAADNSQELVLPESMIQPKDNDVMLHPKSILTTTLKEEPHAANSNEMLIAALDFFFREDDPTSTSTSAADHYPLVQPLLREGSPVLDPLLDSPLPGDRDNEVKNNNSSMLCGPFWNSSFYI